MTENQPQFKYLELQLKTSKKQEDDDIFKPLLREDAKQKLKKEMPQELTPEPSLTLWESIKLRINELLYGPQDKEEQRIIYLDGKVFPPNNITNAVRNQKYSILTFVPLILYDQFKLFYNFFFLLITLSQFIPVLKVGFLFTYIAPLIFVLVMNLIKEAYDDIKRYKRDQEANEFEYTKIDRDRNSSIASRDIKVGDIVEVQANQRIPADMILLFTNDPNGSVYLRTDQLDGETDWKLRRAIKYTQNYGQTKNVSQMNASVTCEPPKNDIYDFKGQFKLEVGGGEGYREGITLENTLWANTYLAAGKAVGLCIYAGKQTRSQMNQRDPRFKYGRTDDEINLYSKYLFIIMAGLAFMIVFVAGLKEGSVVQYFRFILLLSSIIPISLRVNLDFAKLYYAIYINLDDTIPESLTRNSNIPEELGRVQYILTDKTGTLTQNDMKFKKISLETIQFQEENLNQMRKILKKQCIQGEGPLRDIEERCKAEEIAFGQAKRRKYLKRGKELVVRDLVTALVLCHNVTPVEDRGNKVYQASSPDEVALVKFAESINMKLVNRDFNSITIENANVVEEKYTILACFPFSSDTKRMGIILKHQSTGRIIFYLKGADCIMKMKVPEVQRGFLLDECESLAREGLRTLVISQKYLTKKEYEEWAKIYDEAQNSMINRDENVRKAIESLEIDMEFLGITGVEDRLQEDIQQTLESLRNASINIWMLTGDKIETATCIAISAGLKAPTQDLFLISEIEEPLKLQDMLNEFSNKTNCVLIIDGISLACALQNQQNYFFTIACQAPSVICCRCSPTQKAFVTEGIKSHTGKITLSIGDGGNDVAMIQAADIGIGIVGKEGKQAALASDFSITKFKHVSTLLLWHGRLAYKRTCNMSLFIMHRGLIISIIQTLFSLIYYFVAIPIYNGWLMLGYTTLFTMLPVFCLIFDEDVSQEKAMEYPELYKTLHKSRELNFKAFLSMIWKSIFQGTLIIVVAFFIFQATFLDLVTISFTSLIVVELLNIFSELNKITCLTLFLEFLTICSYFVAIVSLKNEINVVKVDQEFIMRVLMLVGITWLPIHIGKILLRRYDPTEGDKIMQKIRIRK